MFQKQNESASCDTAALREGTENRAANLIPKDTVSREMLADYYRACLKPVYQYGSADLGGRSNSEAQSYAMLQSLWMNDRRTFSKVWVWTKNNLQKPEDHLFSWDFDLAKDWRSYPAQKAIIKDQNSATDADTDIAFALLLAGEKWERQSYIEEARKILRGIWDKEVYEHEGNLYVLPGNWGVSDQEIVVNPSYFSPAAYRLFAHYDTSHDWNRLAENSYSNLQKIRENYNRGYRNELPPNWMVWNKQDRQWQPFEGKADSLDYSYDAFRTLWRAGFDQLTSPSFASWDYVSSFSRFESEWSQDNFCSIYVYKNSSLECSPSTTGMAGPLGILSVTNGYVAERIINKYIHDGKLQFPEDSFYGRSWHWFAVYSWTRS